MNARATWIMHKGAEECTFEDLADHRSLTPAPTASWTPVAHADIISMVHSSFRNLDINVVDAQYAIWFPQIKGTKQRDRLGASRMFALYRIRRNDEIELAVAVRSSHDQSLAPRIAGGFSVMVCDNLTLTGEVQVSRKQTSLVMSDIQNRIDSAIFDISCLGETYENQIHRYKQVHVNAMRMDHLIMNAVRADVIPGSAVTKVWEQWEKPEHECYEKPNLWSAYNSFTAHMRGQVVAYPQKTIALTNLCNQLAEAA